MVSYYLLTTGLSRGEENPTASKYRCLWKREYLRLDGLGLLSAVNEYEDGQLYQSPPARLPLPRGCEPSTAAPFRTPYHGQPQASRVTEPASTIPTNDSLALTETWQQPDVMDCFYRMLQPAETKAAQGFPSDYIILGNKDEQQKQIGNANPPPTMELLVRRCVASLEGGGYG